MQAAQSSDSNSPWHIKDSWGMPVPVYALHIQGTECKVSPVPETDISTTKTVETDLGFELFTPKGHYLCHRIEADMQIDDTDPEQNSLKAPMNGTIVAVQAKLNTEVSKGDTLLIMEAMKMEHKVIAPADGKVTEFYFQEGDIIDGGIELLAFEAATA
jgi:3-methylcrotonyl-CoA carboxylase alpha subunit